MSHYNDALGAMPESQGGGMAVQPKVEAICIAFKSGIDLQHNKNFDGLVFEPIEAN